MYVANFVCSVSSCPLYHCGDGVEKDKGKEIHHTEEAAIRGHPKARFLLAS